MKHLISLIQHPTKKVPYVWNSCCTDASSERITLYRRSNPSPSSFILTRIIRFGNRIVELRSVLAHDLHLRILLEFSQSRSLSNRIKSNQIKPNQTASGQKPSNPSNQFITENCIQKLCASYDSCEKLELKKSITFSTRIVTLHQLVSSFVLFIHFCSFSFILHLQLQMLQGCTVNVLI